MNHERPDMSFAEAPKDRSRPGRSTAAGGATLWMGTVIFGGSTVALLAVLSVITTPGFRHWLPSSAWVSSSR